jgi:hypothetical protein
LLNPLAISYRVSESIGNPLANLFYGVRVYWQPSDKFLSRNWQLLQIAQICLRVANSFWSFARGYWLPSRVVNLYKHLQEGCPINKERGNLFAIPLKKTKVKIRIQEITNSFGTYKRFNL